MNVGRFGPYVQLGDEDKPRFSRSNWSTIKYRKRNKAALIDMRALITFVKL